MATSALVEFTKRKIGDNNQLQTFVQEARTVANVIFPETLPFSDKYCKLGVEVVTVNAKNDKHVYTNTSGGLSLHLAKLNEIAKAAKIRTVDSKIQERKVDEKGQVTFISHQVTVEYRTVTGEMIRESYTGKYDYFKDLNDPSKTEKQIKNSRKHAEALAESNALTRAFNKVLPQLPQSFKEGDLSKPFLVPYVLDDKDALLKDLPVETQNVLKEELARERLGIAKKIYGGPAKPQSSVEDAVIVEEQSAVSSQQSDIKQSATAGPTPEEQNKILAEEFRQATQKERTEKIQTLMKRKNYLKDADGDEITIDRIEKNSVEAQVRFIERLLNLPDFREVKSL